MGEKDAVESMDKTYYFEARALNVIGEPLLTGAITIPLKDYGDGTCDFDKEFAIVERHIQKHFDENIEFEEYILTKIESLSLYNYGVPIILRRYVNDRP